MHLPQATSICQNVVIYYACCIAHVGLLSHLIRSLCFTGQENAPPSRAGAPAQPAAAASAAPGANQAVGSSQVEILGAAGWVPLAGAAGLQAMAPGMPAVAGTDANSNGVPTPHVCLHLLFIAPDATRSTPR